MRNCLLIILILLVISGCKKKSESTTPPDYSCDCSKYGMNLINFIMDKPIGLFPFRSESNKWGYIDATNKVVISPSFLMSYSFSHNRAQVIEDEGNGVYAGFIDPSGNYAISCSYQYFDYYFSTEGLIPLLNSGAGWGYLDPNGNLKIPNQFTEARAFHEGLAVIENQGFYGEIDVSGNMVIPNIYYYLGPFCEGKAWFGLKSGGLGYLNPDNTVAISPRFASAGIFVNGLAMAMDFDTPKYGYIDPTGNFRIQPGYQDGNPFWENMAAVKINTKWGFIDTTGTVVIQAAYDDVLSGFCEDMAGVMQSGNWGYINKSGQLVIPCNFKNADVFYCGLAYVTFQDNCFGYIDKSGNTIWKSNSPFKSSYKQIRITDRVRNNFSEKCVVN